MDIPLVDLRPQHEEIKLEVLDGFGRVFESSSFVLGREVEDFEKEFAAFSGVQFCIGVGNGTDALEMILRAVGVGSGDEVILPANTFIATALAVIRAGARPVLVDSDAEYHLMDPAQIAQMIGRNTKAIMPVHLYGQMAPMEAIAEAAGETGIVVVEDAAQSHGATRNGFGPGKFASAAGVSFYPGKNLGAYGDAGAIITNSSDIAASAQGLRNWGSKERYVHPTIGFNSRLDTLQAVVLLAKLRRLARWNEMRRQAARRYDEMLAELPQVISPSTMEGNQHVWHLYVVRVLRRDEVLKKLHAAGVGAGIHYPTPVHLHEALSDLNYREGQFPVAEDAAKEILSLPLYPHITASQQEQVVEELQHALE